MQEFKKVAFYTLGCKLNFSETSTIARNFVDAGFARVEFDETPDVYVINTCSVTDQADKKCRNLVRRALRVNPDAFVAVIGCYAQLKPEEIASIEGVDIVLGANEKFNILDFVREQSDKKAIGKKSKAEIRNEHIKETKTFVPGFSSGDRTRTFLKVQDGCDYFCSFCTIPLARGRSRSLTVAETMQTAREAASTDAREIVLTGVNIGDFGTGTEESFFDLIKELDTLKDIDRLRISSIEPNLLEDEIVEYTLKDSRKFVPHFHIPLQSGNNELLQAMRRRYQRELYADRVARIKSIAPDCCIGVDVIVGFPGETEEKFMDTYNFLNELDVSYFHVFTYSERSNTTAVRLGDEVPMNIRRERSKMLQILSTKKKRKFYQDHLGEQRPVLFEGDNHDGLIQGYTDNYIRVAVPYSESLVNKVVNVELLGIENNMVAGKLAEVAAQVHG